MMEYGNRNDVIFTIINLLDDDRPHLEAVHAAVNDLVQPNVLVDDLFGINRNVPVRSEGYYENVIPNYSLDDFYHHFRMSRSAFEELTQLLLHEVQDQRPSRLPFEKKVFFSIWILAKPESFLAASDRFGIASSTAHMIFFEIVALLFSIKERYIKWPTSEESVTISEVFKAQSGIPGVIGVIDVCHIPIKAPVDNHIDFYNKKGFHSVILQAVCNHQKVFTDIFVGAAGSMHDAIVFINSPLYVNLTAEEPLLHHDQHLLGDLAYPLLPCLMKPYRDDGCLSKGAIRYNGKLSSVRLVVEQAFDLLKDKFQRLKYLDMSLADKIPLVITAACVLHNFALLVDGLDHEAPVSEPDNPGETDPEDLEEIEQGDQKVAEGKRNYIASLLQ